MDDNSKLRPSLWGKGLAWVYGVFVVLVVSVVIFTRFHQVDLVASDYYDQEMRYQDRIDCIARRDSLGASVQVEYLSAEKQLRLSFPEGFLTRKITGDIKLFRPSDARLDRSVRIGLDSGGIQVVDASKLRAGNWKMLIDWKADSLEFYEERVFYID